MGPVDTAFLPLPEGLTLQSVHSTSTSVLAQIACQRPDAVCPGCQQLSERVHGHYTRTVADLPCAGRRVVLHLRVRKFVCGTLSCPQQIFTERLAELVPSYARMTTRLREALQALGMTTGGQSGERLAPKLGIQVSAPTLLRRMRQVELSLPKPVHQLGVDDWAWKKGQTYGTILVDLERHCSLDLLPDREAATVEAWLRIHPEIDWVSRDRGGEYAKAARAGAPQARQVADKFHLLKNLREALQKLLEGKQSCLPEVPEEDCCQAIPLKARGHPQEQRALPWEPEPDHERPTRRMSLQPQRRPIGMSAKEVLKQSRRANRYARYDAVRTLYQQGVTKREISRRLGLDCGTVTRYVAAETFPEIVRPKRGSILDPYKPYLLQRWQDGCWNGAQLYAEIKAQGYPGSDITVSRLVADLRQKHRLVGDPLVLHLDTAQTTVMLPPVLPPKREVTRRMSPVRASWLLFLSTDRLTDRQREQRERLRECHPDVEAAYHLVSAFVVMLAERREEDLEPWLRQAAKSHLPDLKRFATGIRRDEEAVRAAFSSGINNGQTEGQVNRLKAIKRSMYGRANFDLLRLRFLYRT